MARHDSEADLLAETLSEIMGQKPRAKSKYRLKKSVKIGICGLIAVVVISLGFVLLFSLRGSKSPMESELRIQQDSVTYDLYSPAKIPPSYRAEAGSTTSNDGVVFTTLKSSDDTKPPIIISQQAIPGNATIQNLLGLVPPEAIDTPSGKLYLANTETHLTGILVTDSSWVIMSTEKSVSTDTLKELARNFKSL